MRGGVSFCAKCGLQAFFFSPSGKKGKMKEARDFFLFIPSHVAY